MACSRSTADSQTRSVGASRLPVGLNPEDLLEMYSTMVLVRTLDERIWLMNRQGKAAIVASSQGHEAAQLGAVWAMRTAPGAAYFPARLPLMLSPSNHASSSPLAAAAPPPWRSRCTAPTAGPTR